ncbi:hypothetical protein GCM10023081_20110 [Arthrobacter ginkgonis]|uniref:Uncharacterized protein n=1 Tax=Arthrobacter ginkgonis TaxID=1630594 RepID=A0ABP7C6Z3_9MICC
MSALLSDPDNPRFAKWQDYSPPTFHPEVQGGVHAAREALRNAWSRSSRDRMDARACWAAAVEGVWWTMALDDVFETQLGAVYNSARDADRYGQVVGAFRWIRHRHAHEMVSTATAGPARNFFGPHPEPGALFYISPSIRWKRSGEVHSEHDRQPKLRPLYDAHVGGRPIGSTLESAWTWFDRVISACGLEGPSTSEDPSVLT